MYKDFLNYLCCPGCKNKLFLKNDNLICKKCKINFPISNGIISFQKSFPDDLKLSSKKWNELYNNELLKKSYYSSFEKYNGKELEKTNSDILKYSDRYTSNAYLEIGCGRFFNSVALSKEFNVVIGIDMCLGALVIAKNILNKYNIKNYILIQGDVQQLPLKDSCINIVYGGGVIEHFNDTKKCLKEIYRCLDSCGISYNTVPFLNLGSLTYRQIWGNIPDFPILKQIAEIIHIKILKGKHMIFGYEKSFSKKKITSLHEKSGFRKDKIMIDKLEVELVFEFLPRFLRKYAKRLAKESSLFCPMIKIIAKK